MLIERIADKAGFSGAQERASDAYFPYVDHIGPGVMMLSDGSVMGVLRLPGASFYLVLNRERNAQKRRLTAFLNAAADENVEVHIHLVKHNSTLPPPSHGAAVSPYARQLLEDYHASIADELAVLDWFVAVRVKPRTPPFASLKDKAREALSSIGLVKAARTADPLIEVQLEDAMRLGLSTLAPFGPKRLGERHEYDPMTGEVDGTFSDIAEFLYLLRTTQFSPQPLADVLGFVGAGIAAVDATAVQGKRMLRIDHAAGGSSASQTWAAMIGFATPPRRLNQSRFDALLALPGRFVLTLAMRFESRAQAQDRLDLLRRKLIAAGDKAVSDTDDLIDAIDEIAGGRSESAVSRWSLALHGGTPREVDRLVSAARTIIANAGGKAAIEGKGMLSSYLAQLPGAPASTWIRPGRCNTRQLTTLATLAGYPRGPVKARWDHHLFRLISPAGTAYDHDIFVGDVGHGVYVGPNGAGKTVWIGMCIAALDALVRRNGGTQIVFDVDESNAGTILMLGGRYSSIRIDQSGFAPLKGLPNSPRLRAFLRDLIAGVVQTDNAPAPTKAERDGIREGVDFVMEMEPHRAQLRGYPPVHGIRRERRGRPAGAVVRRQRAGLGFRWRRARHRLQYAAGRRGLDRHHE